jgi:hypothetical protein
MFIIIISGWRKTGQQQEDFAKRIRMTVAEAERWLRPVLE